jgi:hypothetical protein
MLLNVDAGVIGRILLWGFKFGTVEPRGRIAPTCTAKGRAGEAQERSSLLLWESGVIPLGNF